LFVFCGLGSNAVVSVAFSTTGLRAAPLFTLDVEIQGFFPIWCALCMVLL